MTRPTANPTSTHHFLRALAVGLVALSACASPTVGVYVGRRGTGVAIGPSTVATAYHVVAGHDVATVERADGKCYRAEVVQLLDSSPEPIAILELGGDVLTPATFAPVGAAAVSPRELQPGDSGSPVYSADGRLVGVVSGVSAVILRFPAGWVPRE